MWSSCHQALQAGCCRSAVATAFYVWKRDLVALILAHALGDAIGLVWLGPAWSDHRFLYALVLWDIAVFLAWFWDLSKLPRPAQIGASRLWSEPPQLGVEAKVALEIQNSGALPLLVQLVEDAPVSFRAGIPELELTVPGGRQSASTKYAIRPAERGDARFGNVYLRYEGPLRIAQRWATVPLQQTVRVYPNLEEARQNTIYLIRSRQIAIEKRHLQQRGQGRETLKSDTDKTTAT